jgi:hypothetical protein
LTLTESPEWGGTYDPNNNNVTVGHWVGPDVGGTDFFPGPVLFHELAHARQDLIGGATGQSMFDGDRLVNNSERQATWLSWIDDRGRVHPADEAPYSENKFRRELGLPERTSYIGERGNPRPPPAP